MAPLTPLKLYRGDPVNELVESFSGYTDLQAGAPVQSVYAGDVVSVPNGGTFNLPFTQLISGPELLDRTPPDAASFLEDGTYALTALVFGQALTAAGSALAIVQVGAFLPLSVAYTLTPQNQWGVCGVFGAAAGDGCVVQVVNRDGVNARDFNLSNVVLVKL